MINGAAVLMYENYQQDLTDHRGLGDWSGAAQGIPDWAWAGGVNDDGRLRNGVRFAPIVNCPGADPHNRHWKAPKFIRSDACARHWLTGLLAWGVHSLRSLTLGC